MDTMLIVAIVIAIAAGLALLGGVWMLAQNRRSGRLRSEFGSEYDYAVGEAGDRRTGEKELRERRERVQKLHIVPLSREDAEHFGNEWREVQTRFVDDPRAAIDDADKLVGRVMEKRGYPVGDFERQAADVSVDHAELVTNYRAAHQISLASEQGSATTEDMRQAMVHYRALFDDLLQTSEVRR
jgi:hypothetical protein